MARRLGRVKVRHINNITLLSFLKGALSSLSAAYIGFCFYFGESLFAITKIENLIDILFRLSFSYVVTFVSIAVISSFFVFIFALFALFLLIFALLALGFFSNLFTIRLNKLYIFLSKMFYIFQISTLTILISAFSFFSCGFVFLGSRNMLRLALLAFAFLFTIGFGSYLYERFSKGLIIESSTGDNEENPTSFFKHIYNTFAKSLLEPVIYAPYLIIIVSFFLFGFLRADYIQSSEDNIEIKTDYNEAITGKILYISSDSFVILSKNEIIMISKNKVLTANINIHYLSDRNIYARRILDFRSYLQNFLLKR